jgi:hypothetical protein
MDVVRRPQRGAAGWAVVVERWRASGLSVEAFCRRDGVNRAGFYRWRTLLSAVKPPPGALAAASPTADFVDLGVLGQMMAPSGRLQLRLDLGAGLVLTLVRG